MIDYIKIDSDILNLSVGSAEKLVLAAGRLPKGCKLSNAQLAGICGVSLRTLIRIVMELKGMGLIRVYKSGNNRTIITADTCIAGDDRLAQRQNDTCQDGVKLCQNVTEGCQAVTGKCQTDTHNLKSKRNKKEKAAERTIEPSVGAHCSPPCKGKPAAGKDGAVLTGKARFQGSAGEAGGSSADKPERRGNMSEDSSKPSAGEGGDIGDFTMKEFRSYLSERLGGPGAKNYAGRAYQLRIAIFTAGSRANAEFLEWVRKRRSEAGEGGQ
ncbi:hypothetical protein L21SP3_00266 [Sedimentisphaera cyanobacteriorum]|uniref:Uncharacterized protein n=1 Tax=Sedimentisphaera cyanobacteriorum TaxID=1940790 RepID=A0A1Q2HMI6_9BACT|nr:helix-turn-helix domain-containing protein [Sedimentisphaera cyanobacteriorum]AQQ08485.1 hypothetical protein L21SP3_00266 [Sedimentisphaera cyanobacteriorum]